MSPSSSSTPLPPQGISSLLDTDLYKLSMQSAVLRFFPNIPVEYTFTNRTPAMRLNRAAFTWLQEQVLALGTITVTEAEIEFLKKQCPFLSAEYLEFLRGFRLRPGEQVVLGFEEVQAQGQGQEQEGGVEQDNGSDDNNTFGDLSISTTGTWLDTILYEIPLLALTSEAYFRFVDRDWSYEGQEEKAYGKGTTMFEAGCLVSEFGSRRRRDLKTQDLVIGGLVRASSDATTNGMKGKLTGTSNVYLAMRHGIAPVGTVAHEWYMAIASITDDYEHANELGLDYWLKCFGEGVLGIALTDTFGTPDFFRAFAKKMPGGEVGDASKTYAEVFVGVRQDSGDPRDYVRMAAEFYESQGITGKSLVFSDSLNTGLCVEYKGLAEKYGLKPSFGVGTFFTNDYTKRSDLETKSKPLNIVIKISKANGRPSIKISDNVGKNTGDSETVKDVKRRLGYSEKSWADGDEEKRW